MGCASCANKKRGSTPKGCKNNGTCSTGGCDKLEVFDWLSNMSLPEGSRHFDVLEIRFKNGRKSFYRSLAKGYFQPGDTVVVMAKPGYDVGVVTLTGELVKVQMKRKKVTVKNHELPNILRRATNEDLDVWKKARAREYESMHEARKMAIRLKLEMKISDVEFQADNTKAIFYYTASGRVDFRELIKVMAEQFRIRIEMRQIGARQESGRLGGIGSCGRELCCTTWLTDFRSVSTSSARYQQLSLNPQKLAGQCGKLKCCLNYELDMYLEAYKDFPSANTKLETKQGAAVHQKTDIFKRQMWFWLSEERGGGKLVQLHLDRVKEIIALNKSGKKPQNLDKFIHLEPEITEPQYENVVGQDELTRFDGKFSKSQRKKRGNKNKRRKPNSPKSNMKNLTVSEQKGTNSNEKPSPQHKTNAKRQNKNK
ncbi:MAG: regulatory iron-sulfur-containing complex subunit RicT [Flavobacteriales bacterium]|nr:regulatory iron-sulfur-containing complex subunit RicT [Flavobacteriales bacterium]